MTIEEHRGPIAGKTIAWVGDGNNVCASFIHAAPQAGLPAAASPARPTITPTCMDLARAERQAPVELTDDPREAVRRRRLRGHRHLGVDGRHRP